MASTSGCSHQLEDLELSDSSCTMEDSSVKSDFVTTTCAREVECTMSSTYVSAVEEHIKLSKSHWSTLVDRSDEEEEDIKMSNRQEFEALQAHPVWGGLFANFTGDGISTGLGNYEDLGELVVGEKFAEGGQAELYEVQIKWNDPQNVELIQREKSKFVLKVLKEGTLLKHVKAQLPNGVLQHYARSMKNLRGGVSKEFPLLCSRVMRGILLKNGRFAFLLQKYDFDLRTLVEHNMKLRSDYHGSFPKEEAELIMFDVALGVEWLHTQGIFHRDLKASNVLVMDKQGPNSRWFGFVADYECSIRVVGTNYFRAPEILHACKERKVNERPEVFSSAADVYSYGMTCYEILTGKLPFEDHPLINSPSSMLMDLVINQHLRPEIPEYIEDWARKLLHGCWQVDPIARPSIGEIIYVLYSNSIKVRRWDELLKDIFGDNYRSVLYREIANS